MSSFAVGDFVQLPRLSGLRLSPDGRRLVVAVGTPHEDGKRFTSSVWELDPAGEQQARRLTRSAEGESTPAFTPSGDLLFVSKRPHTDSDDDAGPALWLLPAAGGEARIVASPAAGVGGVEVAAESGHLLLQVDVHPDAADWEDDARREQAREDAGTAARLYDDWPLRVWDSYLGPRYPRLWTAQLPTGDGRIEDPTDLTPDAQRALAMEGVSHDITPDGSTVVTGWWRSDVPLLDRRTGLVAIDTTTGEHRVLAADGAWYGDVACSPDGRRVAAVRTQAASPERTYEPQLVVIELDSGEQRRVASGVDLWFASPTWTHDGQALLFVADEDGHRPVFRVDLDEDRLTRLTASGAFSQLQPAPDGVLYAMRDHVGRAPHPVRLADDGADQEPREIPSPASGLSGTGVVERLTARAEDGTEVRSWLVRPADASSDDPVPLVVFIHGGPISSWSSWHWRWNPHVLVEHGYAVLLPDPALSTGYGRAFIQRGWGEWGGAPYGDLMAAVESAAERADLDGDRVAAMGGSYGGYMANWVAGRTDRFRCIISHAGIWDLRTLHGTSDLGALWDEQEFGSPYEDDQRYVRWSPYTGTQAISTPMLIIHGENDHRCHIGDVIRQWTDLMRHDVRARFLHFPDENHWVLKPGNIRVWYGTVLAFLDEHLRDVGFHRPELL